MIGYVAKKQGLGRMPQDVDHDFDSLARDEDGQWRSVCICGWTCTTNQHDGASRALEAHLASVQ